MKKMLSCIMAIMTMFTCINISSVKASETTEHEHTWVETTEIVHHDDEYVTKTMWYKNMNWYPHLSAGDLPEGPNKYHLNYGIDGMRLYTDEYDILCWYYGSLDNIPDEYTPGWITIDNFKDYGMTYDEFINTVGRQDVFNNINPEFNPKYDVLVTVAMAYDCKPIIEKEMAAQGFFDGALSWTQSMKDPDGIWSGYLPVSQEEIFVEAYDEIITYHICSDCGESHNNYECNCNPVYQFEKKSYVVDFPYTDNGSVFVTIKSVPNANVGGFINFGEIDPKTGYSAIFTDFSGTTDSNGIAVVEAPFWGEDFADIGGVESAEIKLILSRIRNSESRSWTYYPAEMLDYKIVFDNGTVIEPNVTTQPTTTTTSTETTTTTMTEPNTTSTTLTTIPTTTSATTMVKPTTTSTTSTTTTTSTTSTTSTTTTSTSTITTSTTTTSTTSTTSTTTSTSTSASSTSTTTMQTTTASTTTEPVTTTTEQKYVPVFGDVNCDGEVDIRDVVMLNRYLGGTYELSDQAKVNADCCKSQELNFTPVSVNDVDINEDDSYTIMQHIVHLITLPVQEIKLMNIEIGDVNGDGEFTVADIITMQNWLLAKPDAHLVNWQIADFNGDNRIDVFDLCIMKRMLLAK